MHGMKAFAVAVVVLVAFSGCRERASPEPPASMEGGAVEAESAQEAAPAQGAAPQVDLPRFPLGDGQELRVILGSCDSAGCPISVALFEGGALRSSQELPWPSAEPVLSPKPAERGEGAGDPLEAPPLQAWTSGEEEHSVTSIFQLARLEGGTPGLLVYQTGGFEHVKRHQALYVVREGKVVLAWEAKEGSGPTLSTVALVPSGEAQVLVSFSGFIHPDESEPETWTARVLRWNPSSFRMEPVAPGGLVHVLTLGDFRSARAARAARESSQECLGQFWVLPARPLGGGRRFTLAVMSTRADLIDRLAQQTRECAPRLTQQKIAPERFGPSP
jgi:hypothetical protein